MLCPCHKGSDARRSASVATCSAVLVRAIHELALNALPFVPEVLPFRPEDGSSPSSETSYSSGFGEGAPAALLRGGEPEADAAARACRPVNGVA